jgi:hypothetical protein
MNNIAKIFDALDVGSQNVARATKTMKEGDNVVKFPTRRLEPSAASLSRAVSESAETENYRPPVRHIDMKLGTKLGRQVHVDPDRGLDLAGAIRTLQMQCAVNSVRRQATQQKFHVRRGQKRKDIKRERWRKLFRFSFDNTVRQIQRMRAQGW